jgi:two-component system, NarL family, invasion response regulator UvrY
MDRREREMFAIMIVDDHALLRCGLARMLKASFPDVLIGEAGDGEEALCLAQTRPWDLMILDIGLPGPSGLEVLQSILKRWPALPVLVLTGLADDAVAIRVFEIGAMGYLTKGCSEDNLIIAIRKVLEGGRYLTAAIAEKLVLNLSKQNARKASGGSPEINGRLLDVMLRLGQGDTVKAVAADMSLSIKTVSTYRRRLLAQLHLKSNTDIVRYCLMRGLTQ